MVDAAAKLQDDPNVKIPAAVRAQSERSDAIIRQLQEGANPDDLQQDPPQDPPQDPQDPDPQQDPQDPQDPPQQDPPQQDPQDPDPQQPEPRRPDETSWEHKYNSMRGRYMATKDQVDALTDQVANLQAVIATMNTPPAPQTEAERLITEQEENDYGADLLTVVGKKAREEINPLLTKQEQRLVQLEKTIQSLRGEQQRGSQEKLLETLDKALPEWRELNTNEDFLDWLALPDAYSGAIRHDMLKAAYAQGNPSRVLAFFKGFLAEEAATTPARSVEPGPGTVRVPKVPLAELAAPGKAKTAAASPAPAEKPIITRAQIARFYADVAAGHYKGRDAEKTAAEQMIFSAQSEGRIR